LRSLAVPAPLRPVDIRRRGDLPEPARCRLPAHGRRGVDMGVAVHPGDHAGLAEQEFAQLTGQDPAVCAWRAPVVHQRLDWMMAEQDHGAIPACRELGAEGNGT